jgi:ankyrin repeat protein
LLPKQRKTCVSLLEKLALFDCFDTSFKIQCCTSTVHPETTSLAFVTAFGAAMSTFEADYPTFEPPLATLPRHEHSRGYMLSQSSTRSQAVFTALGPTVLRPPRKPIVYYADRWDAYPTWVGRDNNNKVSRDENEDLSATDLAREHGDISEVIPAGTASSGDGVDGLVGGATTSMSANQEQAPALPNSTARRAARLDTAVPAVGGHPIDSSLQNTSDDDIALQEEGEAVDGPSALMEACWHGRVNVVRKLLREHHAKHCSRSNLKHKRRQHQHQNRQYHPLHAKRTHSTHMSVGPADNPTEALLESDWFGSPLHYACIAGRTSCARLLLYGEDDECKETAERRNKKEVKWEVPVVTSDTSQPSTNVLECNECIGTHHFLRVVDPWARNSYGSTPLHKAAASGSLPTVQLLLSLLPPPQGTNDDMNINCSCGHTSNISSSSCGPENPLETANWRGDRPLHAAARSGSLACCAVLLAAGSNGSARNLAGQTALDVAEAKNHVDAAAVLRAAALQRFSGDDNGIDRADDVKLESKRETWKNRTRKCSSDSGNSKHRTATEMVKDKRGAVIDEAVATATGVPVSLAESWVPSVGAHLVPLDASLTSQRQLWLQPSVESSIFPLGARGDQQAFLQGVRPTVLPAGRDKQKSGLDERPTSGAASETSIIEEFDFMLSPAQRWGTPMS